MKVRRKNWEIKPKMESRKEKQTKKAYKSSTAI